MQDKSKSPLQKKIVLIVEDNEEQAVAIKKLLNEKGREAMIARNGVEGLGMAKSIRPALIITSVKIPELDGFQLTRAIKNDIEIMKTPVILLTGLADVDEVLTGLNCGAEHYITKPCNEEYLMKKVDALIENPEPIRVNQKQRVTEFEYDGKPYVIRASRSQTINLLLSAYENAIQKNKELSRAQESLVAFNSMLEKKVGERTAQRNEEAAQKQKAQAELEASEERYRSIVNSASDAIICADETGAICLWNRKAEVLFLYTAEEALGKDLHELLVPKSERAVNGSPLSVIRGDGTLSRFTHTLEGLAVRKDGRQILVELSITRMLINGKWHTSGIVRDITEQRRIEEQNREQLDELKRWQSVTLDREDRVNALKQEINDLLKRIGEPQRYRTEPDDELTVS